MIVKILMVCLGNICRSPLAHGILESKLAGNNFYIDSAGTGAWHVGKAPDQRSVDVAKKHNIDISKQRARQFTKRDFTDFDLIFVMDKSNYKDIVALASHADEVAKVKLLLDYNASSNIEVPDPYYGGDDGFETVFQMIDAACTNLSNHFLTHIK
jgi:protein-tyrosine phosphatase